MPYGPPRPVGGRGPRRAPAPAAAPLGDIDDDILREALHRVAEWAADYRETIEQRPIAPRDAPGAVASRLAPSPPRRAEPLDRILADLETVVLPGILHWGHPAFLGYFGSTSNGPALVGEIAAAALNVSAMTWKTSPAATELEDTVLSWMRQMIGLSEEFTGLLYGTASVSLVHALAAARSTAFPEARRRGLSGGAAPIFRVYASDQAHSSLEKAMILLGLGEENVVRVQTDVAFALDLSALRDAMEADARRGLRPLAIVATAGTTSTASVDPLRGAAELARMHDAWLHVDAAYGAALALLPERRHLLDGMELADSIAVNGHKWLFVPLDFGALYVKRPEALREVFRLVPEYLRGDAAPAEPSRVHDAMDYGIELGRRFRALKAWMAFRAFGVEGMAARIREHCRLAGVLAARVGEEPAFELAAPVTMAVVCFRHVPPGLGDDAADAVNAEIVERVNASGRAYLTHTRLRGRTVLRVGIGNLRTGDRHLAILWEELRLAARAARPSD